MLRKKQKTSADFSDSFSGFSEFVLLLLLSPHVCIPSLPLLLPSSLLLSLPLLSSSNFSSYSDSVQVRDRKMKDVFFPPFLFLFRLFLDDDLLLSFSLFFFAVPSWVMMKLPSVPFYSVLVVLSRSLFFCSGEHVHFILRTQPNLRLVIAL